MKTTMTKKSKREEEEENKSLESMPCTPCTPPRLRDEDEWEVPETPPEKSVYGFEPESGAAGQEQQMHREYTRKRCVSPEY